MNSKSTQIPWNKTNAYLFDACWHCGGTLPIVRRKNRPSVRNFCDINCRRAWNNDPMRFWLQIKRSGTCWLWTGSVDESGYGKYSLHGKPQMAHRVSWQIANGPIPKGLCVLHNCPDGDNPRCCFPGHLWLGSRAENNADRDKKGRTAFGGRNGRYTHPERTQCGDRSSSRLHPESRPRGERHPCAKVTAVQVIEIRERAARKETSHTMLAIEYGISRHTLRQIVYRATWKWLD